MGRRLPMMTLAAARKAAKLTQMELAAATGVSQTYISSLEINARLHPTDRVVEKLEAALKCRLDFPYADSALSPDQEGHDAQ